MSIDLRRSRDINDALTAVLNCVEMEEERYFVSTADLFNDLFQAYSLKVDPTKIITVENSYVGLHLGEYEASDFERLVQSFSNYENLHAFYALKIINDAKELLKKVPNIQTCTIKSNADNLIIVGDLHGNFRDLKYIIDEYGLPGDKYQFIFNGDFVDRGKQQIEVLLTLLYAYILNPGRVYLNRGNHEDISMNTHSKFHPNFFRDIHAKYDDYSQKIFEAAEDLFLYLPLATIVEKTKNRRFFVTHGGISDKTDLDFIEKKIKRESFKKFTYSPMMDAGTNEEVEQIRSLLWSDPIKLCKNGEIRPKGLADAKGCHFNSKRNIGYLFGYDVTKMFCKKYNFDFILRSHEVREDGFEMDHENCFTIFSASFYQGHQNFAAVCLVKFDAMILEPFKFKSHEDYAYSQLHQSNVELIRKFKRLLINPEYNLVGLFREFDTKNTGYLDFDTWAKVICDVFEGIDSKHLIDLKDYLCVCDDTTKCVKYDTMFSNIKNLIGEEYIVHLENLFRIMDLNHDNKISLAEAKETLNIIHQKLFIPKQISERYLNILMHMDKNDDNCIDFEEFKEAFLTEPENL
jgi:serine/threonine-protein phosphatase with EF-hand domain